MHRVITAQQAELIARAIASHREFQELVARWAEETASEVLDAEPERKRQPRKTSRAEIRRNRAREVRNVRLVFHL